MNIHNFFYFLTDNTQGLKNWLTTELTFYSIWETFKRRTVEDSYWHMLGNIRELIKIKDFYMAHELSKVYEQCIPYFMKDDTFIEFSEYEIEEFKKVKKSIERGIQVQN